MGTRDNPVTIYLDDEEMSQLKDWSNKTGDSISELGRRAIIEYTDHDRLHRVENRLDDIEAMLSDLSGADNTHTHEHDTVTKASETVAKTRQIADRLQSNNDQVVKDDDLERAIKDIAGGDHRTITKYKDELRDRGFAFDHPLEDNPLWFLDQTPWLTAAADYAQRTPSPEVVFEDLCRDYGIDPEDHQDTLEAQL